MFIVCVRMCNIFLYFNLFLDECVRVRCVKRKTHKDDEYDEYIPESSEENVAETRNKFRIIFMLIYTSRMLLMRHIRI